ncbi:uncharacterized protein VTP21DRAFT_4054 [Calcarisporiella thermophila]|uniref:uncharacterized protein n=1 Tax=Calcarisporiella thermophila TaxID=911321 RepID=UPI003743180D
MYKRVHFKYLLLALLNLIGLHYLFSFYFSGRRLIHSPEMVDISTDNTARVQPALTETIVSNKRRARAALVVLARNTDVYEMRKSMQQMEDMFNRDYAYPWVFLNEEDFSDDFKEMTSAMTNAPTYYGKISQEYWSIPPWIDQEKARLAREEMARNKVIYGGSLPYRHMCRFESGFFYRHPLLQDFDYYWRVEPGVEYFCPVDYDPFLFMQDNGKKYGFVITLHEVVETVPTLWETTKRFMKEYPHLIAKNNSLEFASDDNGKTWNLCHFWSNFEIGDLRLWRSEAYTKYFEYLDKEGGFFYERWGDASVHTLAALMFLNKDEIHFFNGMGYCPSTRKLTINCHCNPFHSVDLYGITCNPRWKNITGMS